MSYKIKELPLDERPREKLKLKGKESLSNEELIAIILKTGNKEESVKDLAINLVNSIKNIQELNDISLNDLMKIKGIKEAKAITLIAAIELGKRVYFYQEERKKITNAYQLWEYFKPQIIGLKQEKLFAIFLNTKNEIINYEVVFVGTQNQSITHPREIFNKAIKNSAIKIIIMHNHPTNDTTPSGEDIKFTKEIKEIGEFLKIPLIDHIIIGENNYFSFFENHML
jgi:DNA repair protein RadC